MVLQHETLGMEGLEAAAIEPWRTWARGALRGLADRTPAAEPPPVAPSGGTLDRLRPDFRVIESARLKAALGRRTWPSLTVRPDLL